MIDYIVGGAPKCGTTSLIKYMSMQENICKSSIKEPNFFIPKDNKKSNLGKGLSWYSNLFPNACSIKGEASTSYMYTEGSAQLIKRNLPNCKLIFILRDPTERVLSHYFEDYKRGRVGKSFSEILETRPPLFKKYIYISSYYKHIKRFLNCFDRERVLFVLLSELSKQPYKTIQNCLNHIGIDINIDSLNLGDPKKHNMRKVPVSKLLSRLYYNNPLRDTRLHSLLLKSEYLKAVKDNIKSLLFTESPKKEVRGEEKKCIKKILIEDAKKVDLVLNKNLAHWCTLE